MSQLQQLDFLQRLLGSFAPGKRLPSPAIRAESDDTAGALTQRGRELLQAVGAPDLAARLRVRWNVRMRSTAGTAFPEKGLITLNPRLREFGDEEIDRTLRHELAHLLAHHRAGRRRIPPHGAEWRRACQMLGAPDEPRCHDLPLPRRSLRPRHFYRCPHCALELRRVRPLRSRSACLACCRAHSAGRYDERFRLVKLP